MHVRIMQRADVLAFTALAEAGLEPATAFTTWCEKQSYALHTRAAYGAGLPLPLNYWIPWSQRRAALQRFSNYTKEQVACKRSATPCCRLRMEYLQLAHEGA